MTSISHALLAEGVGHLRLTGNDLCDLLDLTNKLTRVGQDDDLDLGYRRVNLHQRRDHESASLTATVHGLESEVFVRVLHDVRD